MIYIDPPYNTGHDFIYNDSFEIDKEEYEQELNLRDEEGNKQFKENNDSNPRFHSDWCSMIYSRLKIARNLLTDDGVIFISIDDNEIDNLKKICNEIFGEDNFVANIIWQSTGGSNTGTSIVTITEYILVYTKNKYNLKIKLLEKNKDNYSLKDKHYNERGMYYLQKLDGKFTKEHYTESLNYPIEYKGKLIYPGGNNKTSTELWNWRWSKTKVKWGIENDFIEFIENGQDITVKFKNYEKVDNNNNERKPSVPPKNLILSNLCTTSTGTVEINSIIGNGFFEFPKCTKLLKHLLNLIDFNSGIVLDFFSGSATTADAVMQLNTEDDGNRKFIMVQLPEQCDEKSEAFKAGYKNICEIGKERIRRAGKKIVEQTGKTDLDIGFRVFKLDESNMKEVHFSPKDFNQDFLVELEDNIKEDRNSEDLLFSCMLNWGLELSLPHKIEKIGNNEIHIVNENELVACFDKNVTEDVIKKIAEKQPLRVVFRDNSFGKDSERINVEEIFKLKSPNTKIKVL
jgi:adenine-specific DNA-methyltransferase